MTTAVAVPVRALGLGRAAAGLALTSAAVHLLLLDASSLGSLVMIAMALTCLPCAWHLWRRPTPRVWGVVAAMDGAMLLLHAQMLAGQAGDHAMPGMAGMAHDGSVSALMWLGLVLVGAQLVLAGAAALTRQRS